MVTSEKIIDKIKKNEVPVKCHFCGQPIHIDHFAGVMNYKGVIVFGCDNIVCLIEFNSLLEK